jgi:C-terminal processing protease CtpA/Prc
MLGPAVRSARPQPRPRAEGGVWRADILADNVGYVEIISFPVLREFERPAARAMTAVRDTRALIVDMRRNGGGDPRSVGLLVSYFLDGSEPVHINSIVYREPGTEQFTTDENWSQQTPVSYTGKPVYVLTSGDTISGGEAFSYSMQALGRAEVVGSVTVGGANPCLRAPIARELDLCVPRGRAQNPITGTNWEGVGVMPDIEVPGEIALAEALERLGVTPAPTTIEQASLTRVYTPGR